MKITFGDEELKLQGCFRKYSGSFMIQFLTETDKDMASQAPVTS